jgi:anti-sigma factor RsiW
MSKRPLSEDERADLVAYLDGETSGETRRAIESKLSLDPVWRAEAESLKRTWDLLEYLPRPEPSPNFTQRTLSRLAPVRPTVTAGATAGRRWPLVGWLAFGGGWAAAVLLAGLGGYLGYRALSVQGPGDAELTRDLRIIENRRFYEVVDDFDFLQDLDEPDLFGEEGVGV